VTEFPRNIRTVVYEPGVAPLRTDGPGISSDSITIEARLELRGQFGALLFVGFFTDLTTKLMVKVPCANQPKRSATIVTSCLHASTTHLSPPRNDEQICLVPETPGQGDLAREFGSLLGPIHIFGDK
jgi:hypothetical protein